VAVNLDFPRKKRSPKPTDLPAPTDQTNSHDDLAPYGAGALWLDVPNNSLMSVNELGICEMLIPSVALEITTAPDNVNDPPDGYLFFSCVPWKKASFMGSVMKDVAVRAKSVSRAGRAILKGGSLQPGKRSRE
jgi:hypothetical protein